MGNTYGNILAVETTGASQKTADQDNLDYDGVEASHTMAKTDVKRMKVYRTIIKKVADDFEIHPALIAAIISRESRAGNTLVNGWGDYDPIKKEYRAFGLMQVDVTDDGGKNEPEGEWNSETHLRQGTRILVGFINKISDKFPDWDKEQQLKGGIAAYNMGDGNVHSYEEVDKYTTGGDYSNDVVARAIWYERNFWFSCVLL